MTTKSPINAANLDRFMAIYQPALREAVLTMAPQEYGFGVDEVPAVAARMRAAFERGSYNHDGRAIRATCKALGFKHTRTAIEAFLRAPAEPAAVKPTQSFALKAYAGPTAVKAYADKLRAIAGLVSISEGTEHVYFVVENEPTHESAREHATNMIHFAGIKGLTIAKV
jgi:hypothetical protein